MDELILLAAFILLLVIIAPILAVIALFRSNAGMNNIISLNQRIIALEEQVKRLSAAEPYEKSVSPPESEQQIAERALPIQILPEPQPEMLNAEPNEVQTSLTYEATSQPEADFTYRQETVAQPSVPTLADQTADAKSSDKEKAANEQLPGVISGMIGWFLKGNPLAKLGIVLLFFGLVYLIKYSVERELFSVELRLTGAALIGFGLLLLGWRLRDKQLTYALILQGGAIGSLYLTVFGAFKIYTLLPHILAFGLIIAICAASVGLAVLQRALSLAMLASAGGYLAPVLLSTGGGSHVALFSYYLLLSVGILAISVWQPWRILNLLGFGFTFAVAGLWGAQYYQPEYYLSCQLFLFANIIIFGVLSVALSLRQQVKGKEIIDGVLLFGPPLLGFGMQYIIAERWEFGPAFAALGFGLFYLALAYVALRRYSALGPRIAQAGLALGVAFITLTIPLALSPQWTAIAWAVEGLGIVWTGLSQNQKRMAWSGSAILILALCSLFDNLVLLVWIFRPTYPLLIVMAIVSGCFLAAAALWNAHRPEKSLWRPIGRVFIGVGIALWLVWLWLFNELALLNLFKAGVGFLLFNLIPIMLMCVSVVVWNLIGRRLNWQAIRLASWLLWPFMLFISISYYFDWRYCPITDELQWTACWLVVAAVGYWLLKREGEKIGNPLVRRALHLSLFWGLIIALIILAFSLAKMAQREYWGMWEWIVGLFNAFIAAVILSAGWLIRRRCEWFDPYRRLYLSVGLAPIVALLLMVTLELNTMDGVTAYFAYLPLINPLDESVLLAILTFAVWILYNPQWRREVKQLSVFILILLGFYWLNGFILRTLAYYADIRWSFESLWASRLAQTTIALFWTFIALIAMICANKYRRRKAWLAGAVLLAITIAKLFLVDSARGGGLERAIAFIGVALLILVVGYFAPLPPKEQDNQDLNAGETR